MRITDRFEFVPTQGGQGVLELQGAGRHKEVDQLSMPRSTRDAEVKGSSQLEQARPPQGLKA